MITVLNAGDFTTVQDKGRWGYQAFGMPIAGAMDDYALTVVNLLVGNDEKAAVLEMTGSGACFKFDDTQWVAIGGADMFCTLNNQPVPNWSSFVVPPGGVLEFGGAQHGWRSYVAVSGGFDVPVVLGSRSTYTEAAIGGHEGRCLRPGDVLYVNQERQEKMLPRQLSSAYIPVYADEISLRVLPGPQTDMFGKEAIKTFFSCRYTVAPQCTREGYQLKGSRIKTIGRSDILSEAVCPGAIQLPAYGRPLIATADHQTSRGFAKIGYIIKADLSKLAQAKENDAIHFVAVEEAEAIEAWALQSQTYEKIKLSFRAIR